MIPAALVAVALAATPTPPGNDTGCCVSFTNSPVVICMTADACQFTGPKP